MKQIFKTSSGPRARVTGVVYLLYFLLAIFATLLNGPRLLVYSYIVNLIAILCYIALTLLLYYLFKPVSNNLSLLAAFVSLAGCTITTLNLFNLALHVSPLAFFGPYCILLGYLILRSAFLPKVLGVLMLLAGIGWLLYLSPLVNFLSTYIKVLGILSEASLMLWLAVMGVNIQRWRQQAGLNQPSTPPPDSSATP
jgi:hypothetical protein